MTATLLEGKTLASKIKHQVKDRIQKYKESGNRAPGLAVILVGEDPASQIYVGKKQDACTEVGIISQSFGLSASTSQIDLLDLIEQLNQDISIDGILVQLPLPNHIDTPAVVEKITPAKDIDGFHPCNLGRLQQQRPLFRPCTPFGIMQLLETTGIHLNGINATVVGISNIVGQPMIQELLRAGATVTACHRKTVNLEMHVKQADLLISATGNPGLIKGHWIKPGSIVIDVGMNRLANGQWVGDVEFETARKQAKLITPVPGGVGPMTVAALLQNTLLAYERHIGAET